MKIKGYYYTGDSVSGEGIHRHPSSEKVKEMADTIIIEGRR